MKDFYAYLVKELKWFLRPRNLIAWGVISLSLVIVTDNKAGDYLEQKNAQSKFQDIQQQHFLGTPNYDRYGNDGINFLFAPAASSCLFANTVIPPDLTGNINSVVKLEISGNLKGGALKPGNYFFKLDFSLLVLLLVTLAALWYGLEWLWQKEHLGSLCSQRSPWKIFNLALFSRYLIFIAAFVPGAGLTFVWLKIKGVRLTTADYTGIIALLLPTLLMISIFFLTGAILGNIRDKKTARTLVFPIWFLMVFVVTVFLHSINNEPAPDLNRHMQTLLDKFKNITSFEQYAREKYGKFDPGNMEIARKAIEDYYRETFPRIMALERQLKNDLEKYIRAYQRASVYSPVNFYLSTCSEISSGGYENYLLFYDHLLDMQEKFVRFWIDRVYYTDPLQLVPFLKPGENIFPGQARIPGNYWWGAAVNFCYCVLLYIFAYAGFKRSLTHLDEGEIRDMGDIRLEMKKDGLEVFLVEGDKFNRLLYGVFSGDTKKIREKGRDIEIIIDNTDLVKEKNKHRYIYICPPRCLPGGLRVKDLLLFHSRWYRQSRQEREAILGRPQLQPLLSRQVGRLDKDERYDVLMTLVEMEVEASGAKTGSESCIYHFHDICEGVSEERAVAFKDFMEELHGRGAIVVFLTAPLAAVKKLNHGRGFARGKTWLFKLESSRERLKYSDVTEG